MRWKLQKYEAAIFVLNVLGGLAFYWLVVKPSLGSAYWFKACVPAAVSVCYFLGRPLAERMRSVDRPASHGTKTLKLG